MSTLFIYLTCASVQWLVKNSKGFGGVTKGKIWGRRGKDQFHILFQTSKKKVIPDMFCPSSVGEIMSPPSRGMELLLDAFSQITNQKK